MDVALKGAFWLPKMRVSGNQLFPKIFSPISRLDLVAKLPTLPIHGPAATIRALKDEPRLFHNLQWGTHDEYFRMLQRVQACFDDLVHGLVGDRFKRV